MACVKVHSRQSSLRTAKKPMRQASTLLHLVREYLNECSACPSLAKSS
jgi:hypothetical protein